MIKKAVLIVFTFSALVGAHLCYVQGFGMVADYLASTGVPVETSGDQLNDAAQREAQLARENFGPGHWTTSAVKISYYDQAKGSYMYAMDYDLSNGGKTMRVRPFAMIAVSKDGRAIKTITSDEAIIDMNQPYGFTKSKEPQKVVHARLIGKVMIRDDKGTRENRLDDLLIGPMTQVDYDEPKMEITSESDVVIQDQEMVITGTGLWIELRRKVAPTAEPGAPVVPRSGAVGGLEAKTAILRKNIHIVSSNVGSGGVLMGKSRPDAQGNTPLDLRCTGQMRVDLPEAPKPAPATPPGALPGPKAPDKPAEPTYARFNTNVRVIRGTTQRDQLDCDTLYLVLRPDPKAAQPTTGPGTIVAARKQGDSATTTTSVGPDGKPTTVVAQGAPPGTAKEAEPTAEELAERREGKGSLSGLKLRKAIAQGHNVWVQSEAQGMKARCTELVYDKLLDEGKPDQTYLNAGPNRKIFIEKVNLVADGQPNPGSVRELMRLKSTDATILDRGEGQSLIIANGPGEFEQRPNASESTTQRGWFEDKMQLNNFRDPSRAVTPPDPTMLAAGATPDGLRRQVTLFGTPKLEDIKSGTTLDARDRIVAEFEPAPSLPGAPVGPNGKPADGPTRIKWLKGYEDVHLTTPSRTLTAYRTFEAWFVHPEPVAAPAASPAPAPGALAQGPQPLPTVAPTAPLLAVTTPPAEAPLADAQPDAPPPAQEGAVDGRANHVWARVLQTGGSTKGEIQRAILRSDVVVHQDPAPGERTGRDVKGERVEVDAQGKGLMRFQVLAQDPDAALPEPKTRLASSSRTPLLNRNGLTPGMARVEFDGKILESPGLIGLDQQRNFAWCDGQGTMYQQADRGFFDDKGLDSDRSRPKEKGKANGGITPRDAMVVTWNDEMRFYGHSVDKFGRPAAKVELMGVSERIRTIDGRVENRRGAVARMTNAAVYADVLHVYFDRTIDLSKPTPPPGTKAATQPQAEMALVEAWGDHSSEGADWKYFGVDVTSRKFFEGTNHLMEKHRIMHTHVIYNKRTGDYECPGPGRVFLYQGAQPKRDRDGNPLALRTSTDGSKTANPATPTLKLTEITFTELMQGRFGVARDGVESATRTGNFTGNVQAVNGIVADEWANFNFDELQRWPDAVFLSADVLQVRSEPLAGGVKGARSLLVAEGNAITRTVDRIIQGDRITHDTSTSLSYIYADNGKLVSVAEQRSIGQPVSTTRGTSAFYNNKTRQFQLDDPTNMRWFDLRTGDRPKATFPPDEGGSMAKFPAIARKRQQQMRTQRSSAERKPFSNGQ